MKASQKSKISPVFSKYASISTFYKVTILLITIFTGYIAIKDLGTTNDLVYRTFYNNSYLAEQINKLTPGSQLSYFKQILGEPQFAKTMGTGKMAYTFVNSKFYIYAITDSTNAVISYSITQRDKNFTPEIKIIGRQFYLGKSKFGDMNINDIDFAQYFVSANHFQFFEGQYGPDSKSFVNVVYSLSDTGYISNNEISHLDQSSVVFQQPGTCTEHHLDFTAHWNRENLEKIRELTSNIPINTITLLGPNPDAICELNILQSNEPYFFGPDFQVTRLLLE